MRSGELPRIALRLVLGALLLGGAAVLASGATGGAAASATAGAFQRVVGGLGLGTALDLTGDAAAFDVRLGTAPPPHAHPERAAAAWIAHPSSSRVGPR